MYRYDVCVIDSSQPSAWYLALAFACARSRVLLHQTIGARTIRTHEHIKNDTRSGLLLEHVDRNYFCVSPALKTVDKVEFLIMTMPVCAPDGSLLPTALKLVKKIAQTIQPCQYLIMRQSITAQQLIVCKRALEKDMPGVCVAYCPMISSALHPLEHLHTEPQLIVTDTPQQAQALKALFAQLTDTVTIVYTHHYLEGSLSGLSFGPQADQHHGGL